jgi:hypothetical protein
MNRYVVVEHGGRRGPRWLRVISVPYRTVEADPLWVDGEAVVQYVQQPGPHTMSGMSLVRGDATVFDKTGADYWHGRTERLYGAADDSTGRHFCVEEA